MLRCRVSRFLAALLLSVLALPAVAEAAGRTASVSGKVVSLSTAARTLTLKTADGQQVALRVNPSSRLLRNGAPVRLAGVVLGDKANAQFERRTLRLVSLRASGPATDSSRGALVAIDPSFRSLAVGTASGPREFKLTPATLFIRNGRPARAGDLVLQDALTVHAVASASGQPVAVAVVAEGREEEEIEGTISGITGSDVTITPRQGRAVTVHVNGSTIIRLHLGHGDRIAGALADLEVGMKAEAEFDPVSFVAFKLDAEKEEDDEEDAEVKGTVTAVNPGAGTITIEPRNGSAVTLTVDGSTRIKLDGDTATLGDIPVGAEAEAEFDRATLLASKVEAETEEDDDDDDVAEVEGKVTAVSATSITIAGEKHGGSGTPVTLTLNGSTVILIDDRPGTAADIEVGDEAEARYDSATKVALRIKVEDEDDEEEDD